MIAWACTAITNFKDWDLAQALIEAAIEFAKDFELDQRPWDLIPDIEHAAKIGDLIKQKVEEYWAADRVNLKHYLNPEEKKTNTRKRKK